VPPPSIEYCVGPVALIVIVMVPSVAEQLLISVLLVETITGEGFTVIVYVVGVPVHEPKAGVIVMVAIVGEGVELVAIKPGTPPLPLAARPMDELLFVHVNVAPAGVLDKLVTGTVSPAQIVMSAGAVAVGVWFTITVVVPAGLVQPETVAVTE